MTEDAKTAPGEGRPCLACGGTKAYAVTEALVPNYEYSNSVEPLTLTAANLDKESPGFFSPTERVPVKMSARVCAGCGRVDFFVQDLAVLERFARARAGNVRRG